MMHIVLFLIIVKSFGHCHMTEEVGLYRPSLFIFSQPFLTKLVQFHFIFNCKFLLCFISVVLNMERYFHTEESKLLPRVSHEHRSYLHPSSGKEGAHHFGKPIACHPMSPSQFSGTLIVEHSSLYNKEALLLINHFEKFSIFYFPLQAYSPCNSCSALCLTATASSKLSKLPM